MLGIVTGRTRPAISFVQMDGDCGNVAEQEEVEGSADVPGNVRADAEEWQEFNFNGEVTTEVNFRRVNGSNYRALKVAVWPYKNLLKFIKKGDFIIVYAPEGLDAQNIQRRLMEASGARAIDFLRKIREATYEYVG